jgi:hypothetical protein
MERRWLISAAAALSVMAAPAWAEDKVSDSETPAPPAPAAAAPAPVPAAGETKPVTPVAAAPTAPGVQKDEMKAPPKFTYGGTVDAYFSSGWNDPGRGKNGLAIFDPEDENGAHLGYSEVWAQYARDPIGFRLDVMWGPAGRVVNFAERPNSGDEVWDYIQQAYISVNLNKKGTTYADFGRWVTPVGAEVIEAKDNYNYSRGILFGFAIPFTHTGLRVYHYLNDTDYVMAHVSTGWDRVSLNNSQEPGFGITFNKVLNPKWTFLGSYLGGEEPNANGGGNSYRNLVDVVLSHTANEKLTYVLNADLGEQSGDFWFGIAALAKYQLNAKSYVAGRAEFLHDADGVRFGTLNSTTGYGVTVTYAYLWNKYFQTRAEYRHDFSNRNLFPENRAGLAEDQGRFIVSAILSY